MNTPVLPAWDRFAYLYGEHARCINAVLATIAIVGLSSATFSASATSQKGQPPITSLTQASGGPLDPERAALTLDRVDLEIEIDSKRKFLSGLATLVLRTRIPQKRLLIDLDQNFHVASIEIDGVTLSRSSWGNPDGRLSITLPHPIAAGGSVVAKIAYAGRPHEAVNAPWDDGVVWSQWQGRPWIATTAQGYGCDLFWPCLDFPAGEVGLIRMAITSDGDAAIANGCLISSERLVNGRSRWVWEARNINPYLVAINIGPFTEMKGNYESRYGNRIPLHFWHRSGKDLEAAGLFAEFAPTLDFFEAMIGPYPFASEKMGVVETPHLGMEHQTVNAYGNDFRKDDTGFDWLFQHELAHEWFGNQMTVADWDDFWLHEGYGQYMQPLYGQWREGEARYAVMMAEQRRQILNRQPLVSGHSRTSDDVYKIEKGGPGQDIYYKGAWVLHTLRYLIGDKAFFDATRELVYGRPDPRPGNFKPRFTSTAEFEERMNSASGQNLGWFYDVYLREAELPKLIEERSDGLLTLRWKTSRGAAFPMPIDVQINGQIQRLTMVGGTQTINLPDSAHVVIDPMARVLRHSEAISASSSRK